MNTPGSINVLIAEDNDVTREMMASILRAQGYEIFSATNADEAIDIIRKFPIDMALVDINMAPAGGFDFIRHLLVNRIKIPTVIVTADTSSDLLMKASELGAAQVIHKPVSPDRLTGTVRRILERQGIKTNPLATSAHHTQFTPAELMDMVIDMAAANAASGQGRPFAAILADAEGRILGKGVNGAASRADPVAHAEVMAIRQAAERLGKTDLAGCVLYASSEPTAIGRALAASVGLAKVCYGLSHTDIQTAQGRQTPPAQPPAPSYEQMAREDALAMFLKWQAKKE